MVIWEMAGQDTVNIHSGLLSLGPDWGTVLLFELRQVLARMRALEIRVGLLCFKFWLFIA